MPSVESITQEQYDKLKTFLISNFNVRFLQSNKPHVAEFFEITTETGKLLGSFLKNNSLEINSSGNIQNVYNAILNKIKQLNGQHDESCHKMDNFPNDFKSFILHVTECSECKTKLLEILQHARN